MIHPTVGHLGIVAGAYEALGIGAVIDRAIPKTRHHNLTHSETIELMVLKASALLNVGSTSSLNSSMYRIKPAGWSRRNKGYSE